MKIILLPLLSIFSVTLPAWAQQTIQEQADKKLRRIKTITEWNYHYSANSQNVKAVRFGIAEYDKNGRLLNQFLFDSAGNTRLASTFKYKDNRVVESRFYNEVGKLEQIHKDYTFDGQGNILSEKWYESVDGKFKQEMIYVRDSSGRPIKCLEIYPDTNLNKQIIFTYTPYGDIWDRTTLSSGGAIQRESTRYNYDRFGEVKRSFDWDEKGEVIQTLDYEYDPSGNVTSLFYHDAEGTLVKMRQFQYEFYPLD